MSTKQLGATWLKRIRNILLSAIEREKQYATGTLGGWSVWEHREEIEMRVRKRNSRATEIQVDACRIPSGKPGGQQLSDVGPAESSPLLLVRRRALDLSIVLLAIVFVSVLTIASLSEPGPSIAVTSMPSENGPAELSVSKSNLNSTSHVYLLNGTELTLEQGWDVTSGVYWRGVVPSSVCNWEHTTEGFRVEMNADDVRISRWFYLAVDAYTDANFSLVVASVSGTINVTAVMYGEYSGPPIAVNRLVAEGFSETLTCDLPLDDWESVVYGPVYQVTLAILVSSNTPAEFIIRHLSIEASPYRIVNPVVADLKTSNGSSIYANPHSGQMEDYPLVVLSGSPVALFPYARGAPCYLPSGNYSIKVVWRSGWGGGYPPPMLSYDLQVNDNESVTMSVRVPMIRVQFIVPAGRVMSFISIDSDYEDVYWEQLYGQTPEYLYLPAHETGFGFDIHFVAPWARDCLASFHLELNASYDIAVRFNYPYFMTLGVPLTALDIAVVAMFAVLIAAVVVRLRRTIFVTRTHSVLSDPRLIPTLLTLVGGFLPWYGYSQVWYSNFAGPVEYAWVFAPLSLVTVETQAGLMPTFAELMPVLLPWAAAMFWFPVIYTASRIGIDRWKGDEWVILMMAPFAFSMTFAVPALFAPWTPAIGLLLVLTSPVIYFAQIGIRKLVLRGFSSSAVSRFRG